MFRNIFERIQICWYVLTKKHYAFYSYDTIKDHKVIGAECYIDEHSFNDKLMLKVINKYNRQIIDNKCKE